MVAIKPREFDRLLAAPDRLPPLVLIFGPDAGLVAERGEQLVKAASAGSADPFSLVRLDGAALAADPARLADEARTIALFGGRRTISVRDLGSRSIEPAVAAILADPPTAAVVVIEAGDLKKTGLRKRVEDDRRAVAIACYADEAADLDRIIDEEARAARLTVEADARAALHLVLGADRRLSRSEVAKLCLYCRGQRAITLADVTAVVADAAAAALDDVVDAAFAGDLATLDREGGRLADAGTHPSVVLSAALRHAHALARGRALVDAGREPGGAVERMVPPVFFRRKPAVTRALAQWTAPRLAQAAARLDDAVAETRLMPSLGRELALTALMAVALMVRGGERRR